MTETSPPLLEKTLQLLDSSELPTQRIAKGAAVGVEWLKKLRRKDDQGGIPDPSVRRIQRVHDYLVTGRPQKAPRKQVSTARKVSRAKSVSAGAES